MGWGELLVAARDSLEEKLSERKKDLFFLFWAVGEKNEEKNNRKKGRKRGVAWEF